MAQIDDLQKLVRHKLQQQQELVSELLRLREQLPGSLFARFSECGKEDCVCREGHKHGPYYVLSTRSGGKGRFAYLDSESASEARKLTESHRAFRDGMKRLKETNEELVGLLKAYQAAAAEAAGRRVGIAAAG